MATVISRDFQTVLALPVAKIQSAMASWSVTPTDTTRCFSTLASDEEIAEYPPDDRFIAIRPKDFVPDAGMQAGAGTNAMRFDGTLQVMIWNRLYVDQASRDDQWIINSTLGVTPLMTLVTRACEQHMPVDSDGNFYYIQPFRLLSPGWVFPTKKIDGWGRVESSWSLVFHFAFS